MRERPSRAILSRPAGRRDDERSGAASLFDRGGNPHLDRASALELYADPDADNGMLLRPYLAWESMAWTIRQAIASQEFRPKAFEP